MTFTPLARFCFKWGFLSVTFLTKSGHKRASSRANTTSLDMSRTFLSHLGVSCSIIKFASKKMLASIYIILFVIQHAFLSQTKLKPSVYSFRFKFHSAANDDIFFLEILSLFAPYLLLNFLNVRLCSVVRNNRLWNVSRYTVLLRL